MALKSTWIFAAAIGKVQLALGSAQMKSNGWSSHSWFNDPLMCVHSVCLKEFLLAGREKLKAFIPNCLASHSFPRSSVIYENIELSSASFSINRLQEIAWTRVFVLLEKLPF